MPESLNELAQILMSSPIALPAEPNLSGEPLMTTRVTSLGLRLSLRFALFAALVGGASECLAKDGAGSTSPRIGTCRVGIGGQFKVGFWTPVWVDVVNTGQLKSAVLEVTVNDSDGVATTMPAEVPVGQTAESISTCLLYTRIGKIGGAMGVKLIADGATIDEITLTNAVKDEKRHIAAGLPATSELLVEFGAAPVGLAEAFPNREGGGSRIAQRIVALNRVADLPTEWFGYEGVDALVIAGGDGILLQELVADKTRFAALKRWVELGGKLVLMCGPGMEALLVEDSPLADLVPGKFDAVVGLPQTGTLEHFAESTTQISPPGSRIELLVPKLTVADGSIEVYAGQKASDLPLIIRAPRGFGEVSFAAVDVSQPPLATWPGRKELLRRLMRPYLAGAESSDAPQTLVTLGYDDLSGALRHWLGVSFRGVTTASFLKVAFLVLGYLVLLGPVNYWFTCKVLQRPRLAWVTFPLLVLATSGGSWWLVKSNRGSASRVNQIELIDFDLTTGQARGTYWATLFSSAARRYDLALRPRQPVGQSAEREEVLFSWFGLPGIGVGGMQAAATGLGVDRLGYRYRGLNGLEGVPILSSATKSFLSRWVAPHRPLVNGSLKDDDGLVVGTISNETGETLHDARLLYGTWGYRLGDLQLGQKINIGEELRPMHAKTLIGRSVRGASSERDGEAENAVFFAERATGVQILNLMMFYDAAGGASFAQLPSRFQSYCDFSRLLHLGRAVLVANVNSCRSQLIDPANSEPLVEDEGLETFVYRFVLPVERSTEK